MSDYIATEMTADDLLEHIKSRPKMYDIYVELLARAWDQGDEAGWNNSWRLETDWMHNPYKEAPFA